MSDLLDSCSACASWRADAASGHYRSDCLDCRARALALSPAAFKVRSGGDPGDLRAAIARVFGEERDKYAAGRKLVAEWMDRIKAATGRGA